MLSVSKSIVQKVHVCATHKKPRLLLKYVATTRQQEKDNKIRQPGSMIIFCNKIITLKFVHKFMVKEDIKCEMLHGQLDQKTRDTLLSDFKAVRGEFMRCCLDTEFIPHSNEFCVYLCVLILQGKIHTLVSTDVAARGIHIKRLAHVVNYDFPSNIESYCHRVGRTGRQGATGVAYSLITRQMAPLCGDLIALLQECEQVVEPNLIALQQDFAFNGIASEDSGDESTRGTTEKGCDQPSS